MLYYREHNWMLVLGRSVFEAHIDLAHRTHEDIDWHLNMHFAATGAQWRRVKLDERPSLNIRLSFYEPNARHWTDLERVAFWNPDENGRIVGESGWLAVRYNPAPGEEPTNSILRDHIWRVAARDGRFFTIELAAFADGRDFFKELAGIAVLADGEEEELEPDEAFWKANAQLYLIDSVPFGIVRVEVPRNIADREMYAQKRAKAMLGVDAVEHIESWDLADENAGEFKGHEGDIHVQIHYHGYYED